MRCSRHCLVLRLVNAFAATEVTRCNIRQQPLPSLRPTPAGIRPTFFNTYLSPATCLCRAYGLLIFAHPNVVFQQLITSHDSARLTAHSSKVTETKTACRVASQKHSTSAEVRAGGGDDVT